MFAVLTPRERDKWYQALHEVPYDIYHTPEYCQLYEENGDGQAFGIHFSSENGHAFHCFLKRPITGFTREGLYDIITPYGYGGPIFSNSSLGLKEGFHVEFINYAQENGLVSEFIRFDPLLKNEQGLDEFLEVRNIRRTVFINLQQTPEQIFQDIISKNRNMIRKAEKLGVEIEESKGCAEMDTFIDIYHSTMDKNDADSYYYFTKEYFAAKHRLLGDKLRLFLARHEGRVIAGALFMVGPKYLHYDLAGSLREALPLAPNNLLLYKVALWGREQGLEAFHLGGGHKGENDSLFKFKKSFTHNNLLDFAIGKRVFNGEYYEVLCNEWLEKHPGQEEVLNSGFFPGYRIP